MKNLLYLALGILLLSSCKKDPETWESRGNNGWEYYEGDGEIQYYHDVVVNFDIENNLNIDGSATITDNLNIGNDLNLNKGGLTIIDTYYADDTVYIKENMNVNDSLLIFKGVVIVHGNLNVNATGILNVSDSARLYVDNHLNNAGHIHGARNIYVNPGRLHDNSNFYRTEPLNLRTR